MEESWDPRRGSPSAEAAAAGLRKVNTLVVKLTNAMYAQDAKYMDGLLIVVYRTNDSDCALSLICTFQIQIQIQALQEVGFTLLLLFTGFTKTLALAL